MEQLYWHGVSIESEGGVLTLIAGESPVANFPLPFIAPIPFAEDQSDVEWQYIGTWDHRPSDAEQIEAEIAAGFNVLLPEKTEIIFDLQDDEPMMLDALLDSMGENEFLELLAELEADCS